MKLEKTDRGFNKWNWTDNGGKKRYSWPWAKHAKVYSDLLQDLKSEPLTALGSQHGDLNFCVRSTHCPEDGDTDAQSSQLQPRAAEREHLRNVLSFFTCRCSGKLRTQKLKSNLLRTQILKVLPLQLGVDQYIATHATLTARDFFFANFYSSGPFTCIFSKTSSKFCLC